MKCDFHNVTYGVFTTHDSIIKVIVYYTYYKFNEYYNNINVPT